MNNVFLLVSISALVIIVGSVGTFWLSQNTSDSTPLKSENKNEKKIDSSVTPRSETTENILRAGGSSYFDPQGLFTFLYPPDYKIDTQNNEQHTRIYKSGKTQQGQTEMYDGVIIVFERINLDAKTLNDWVDESIKNSTIDGTIEVIKPKKSTTVNGYPGFTYILKGLGESEYFVLQKDSNSNSAVSITTFVADPENVGFQKEVDAVISTLQLLK